MCTLWTCEQRSQTLWRPETPTSPSELDARADREYRRRLDRRLRENRLTNAMVLVLTTVISEAGHEVAVCEDERSSQQLADSVLALVEKIGR